MRQRVTGDAVPRLSERPSRARAGARIMVSALSDVAITAEALRDGAFGYVPNPFDLRYLQHVIAMSLGVSSR